jgi:hypothetical protein
MNPHELMMKGECSVGRLAHLNNAQCAAAYAGKLWGIRANPESLPAGLGMHKFAAWAAGDLSSLGMALPPTVSLVFSSPLYLP